jgi:hypothetical protein
MRTPFLPPRRLRLPIVTATGLLSLGVAACEDTSPLAPPPPSIAATAQGPLYGLPIGGHVRPSAEERQAASVVARALALALRNSDALDHVKSALATSRIREQKLHFASFISGRGGPLLAAALRESGLSTDAFFQQVRSVRDLEFYMPVRAHREHWTGAESPLVAVALTEDGAPEAFNAIGAPRYLNRVYPPNEPVLVLAPVETDFRRQIELNAQGKAESACVPSRTETLAAAARRCAAGPRASSSGPNMNSASSELDPSIVGLYATEIAFERDECGGECWLWGDPEYEMHVHGKLYADDTKLHHLQCASANASTSFWQPGERSTEYEYNQDGPRYWSGKVKLLSREKAEQVMAADPSGWVVEFWEDDTEACLITNAYFGPGSLLVSAAGSYIVKAALRSKPLTFNGTIALIVGVYLSSQILWDVLNGGDDLIGVAVDKDSTPFQLPPGAKNNVVILNDDGQYRGRATIKFHTAQGPYIGPVASVKISHSPGTKFPVGSNIQAWAYGVDEDGWYVPGRPVSWSSSNPSVAPVDANGIITGNQQGSATITATIDGVPASIAVDPTPVGDPVAVHLDHEFINLQPGQWMYVYARLYDSNGFEVPVAGNYHWESSDQSACQVGYGSVDGEAYLVGNGGTGAQITVTSSEGLTDSLYCSVGGGDALIPVRPGAIGGIKAEPPPRLRPPSRTRGTTAKGPVSPGHR